MVVELCSCPANPCRGLSRSPRGPWIIQQSAPPLHLCHKSNRLHRGHFPEGPSPAFHPLSAWRHGAGERLNGLVLAWRQHAGIYLCFSFFPCYILHTSLLLCLLLCFLRRDTNLSQATHACTHTITMSSPMSACVGSKHNLTGGHLHWQHGGGVTLHTAGGFVEEQFTRKDILFLLMESHVNDFLLFCFFKFHNPFIDLHRKNSNEPPSKQLRKM